MCESLMGDWTCFVAPIKELVTDVFFFSVLIFVFTFTICMGLKALRESPFFPSFIRKILSDFAVLIAILSMSTMDVVLQVNTPKLVVPSELKPN